jgi:hypothetical protein
MKYSNKVLDKYIDVIAATYGPNTNTFALYNSSSSSVSLTRDGRTIASWLLKQPDCIDEEKCLLITLHTIARDVERELGDGTTTAMLAYLLMQRYGSRITLPIIRKLITSYIGKYSIAPASNDDKWNILTAMTHIDSLVQRISLSEALSYDDGKLRLINTPHKFGGKGFLLLNTGLNYIDTEPTHYYIHVCDKVSLGIDGFAEFTDAVALSEGKPLLFIANDLHYLIESELALKDNAHIKFIKYSNNSTERKSEYEALVKALNNQVSKVVFTKRGMVVFNAAAETTLLAYNDVVSDRYELETNVDDIETFHDATMGTEIYLVKSLAMMDYLKHNWPERWMREFNKHQVRTLPEGKVCANVVLYALCTAIKYYWQSYNIKHLLNVE